MLAANAAWRPEVVPSPPPEPPAAAEARRAKRLTRHPRMRLAGERPCWNDLLERVFRVDGFACPGCGGALAYGVDVLVKVTYGEGAQLLAAGVDVFGGPTAVDKLRAAEPGATEEKQYLNLPALGLCLGGFGKRKLKEGRIAIAYAPSQRVMISFLGKSTTAARCSAKKIAFIMVRRALRKT